jgi:hypothetical protein
MVICRGCGQLGHVKSECWELKIICYGCNQEGHMKPDCLNKPPGGWPAAGGSRTVGGGSSAGGRNFGGNNSGKWGRPFGKLNCTTLEEVGHSDQVVIGTLSILSHPGKVLFDTRATTSFISKQFMEQYGIRCSMIESPITVLSAGGTLVVTHIRRNKSLGFAISCTLQIYSWFQWET